MFAPGDRVGVAVSGGADSVCLLHVLVELAPRWNLKLEVLHVDHGLRGAASQEDAAFVEGLAGRLGLPFHLERASGLEGNIEEAARELRRRFFLKTLAEAGLNSIALGHTRNDQAETVLFRLLRGAGVTGLAAMRPKTAEGFVRPMLATGRGEILEFLRERRIPWREDHTNAELVFARNRIRHELLPRLEREWNPAIVEALCRMAVLAAEDEEYWEAEVGRAAPQVLREAGETLIVDCARLEALPPALGRRILRSAVGRIRGGLRGVEFDHIDALLDLASRRRGDGRLILPGVDALRSFDFMRLAKPEAPRKPRDWSYSVSPPARIPLDDGKCLLCLEVVRPKGYTGVTGLDGRRVTGKLELRNWRPGDSYQPAGRGRPEKLKTLFQQARIPLWERRNWPILAMGGQILWTRRFGPAAGFAATGGCAEILEIREVWSGP